MGIIYRVSGKTSKYKGVYLDTITDRYGHTYKRFRSSVSVSGKRVYGGCFKTEKEAALSFNKLAKKYQGEYAYLNRVDI